MLTTLEFGSFAASLNWNGIICFFALPFLMLLAVNTILYYSVFVFKTIDIFQRQNVF